MNVCVALPDRYRNVAQSHLTTWRVFMKAALSLTLLFGASIASAQDLQVQNLTVTGITSLATPPVVTGGCSNILSYGGSGNGTTDNTQALLNALAAATNGRACVYFLPGSSVLRPGSAIYCRTRVRPSHSRATARTSPNLRGRTPVAEYRLISRDQEIPLISVT